MKLAVSILKQILKSVFYYGLGHLKSVVKIWLLYESCKPSSVDYENVFFWHHIPYGLKHIKR